MHQGKTQGDNIREGSNDNRQINNAVQEYEHELHYIDWPMFMSAVDRQKLLQGKILRAAKYIAALESCPVAIKPRNSDVRPKNTGST